MLEKGEVSLALVQGGAATAEDRERLQSLGSLFLEAVWVFTRPEAGIHTFSDMKGKRIAAGAAGSGTYRLAMQLLKANGITESNAEFAMVDYADAAQLLAAVEIDAAIFVASAEAPVVRDLLTQPGIALLDLERAPAYDRLFSFLTPVTLNRGVLDLGRDIPPHDTRLIATPASLVAPSDLNPNLIPALLDAVTRVHAAGGVLERKRQFPAIDVVDIPLNDNASRDIRTGRLFSIAGCPIYLRSARRAETAASAHLRFTAPAGPHRPAAVPVANTFENLPVVRRRAGNRHAPPLGREAGRPSDYRTPSGARTRGRSVSVSLADAGEQYHLRLHIRLLQERLDGSAAAEGAPAKAGGKKPFSESA